METVLAFDGSAGELAESIAFDLQGNAYVTFAPIGEILKITPDGSQSTFAILEPGDGFLAGVTVDEVGNVYAGLSSFNEETHGVWRIRQDGSSERIAAFPTNSLPNDMVLDKQGNLFVTDSIQGAVWRIPPNGDSEIWLQSDLLEGRLFDFFPFPLGANGIAFGKDGALYVTNVGLSRIVSIPVNPGGKPGTPMTFVEDERLGGPDGITFDARGNLYSTNGLGGGVFCISLDGEIEVLVSAEEINDPSSVAFGTRAGDRRDLYITNFAFFTQENPALLKMNVGVRGADF